MSDRSEALRLLTEAKRVLLLSHVPPDGDGLGAGLALLRFVRSRGGDGVFAAGGPIQENLGFLVEPGELDLSPGGPEGPFDLAVALDSGSFRRLGPAGETAKACPEFLSIDHHATNERYARVNWVEGDAPATGEMAYRLLGDAEAKIDARIALPLYVALVTDTGRFSYSNTTPAAHRMAAELVETGIDTAAATGEIYRSLPLAYLRLTAMAVDSLVVRADGLLATVVVTPEMVARTGADPKDVGDLVDIPIGVRGVEVGLLLREADGGGTKVSLRSRRWFSVSDFAARYGGGGHHRAAGAVLDLPLHTAAKTFPAELEAAVREGAES